MPKTNKLMVENSTFNEEVVRIRSILLWSLMRCKISPVIRVSKNAMGNRINLMKKSETKDMFILVLK